MLHKVENSTVPYFYAITKSFYYPIKMLNIQCVILKYKTTK